MKVNLLAANGLYVTAEYGGGVDPRINPSMVALYANREFAGGYETFDLVGLGNNKYALKTFNGNYITAEGGGGSFLRTDAISIGAWEVFTLVNNGFLCSDGIHWICAEILWDNRLIANRTAQGAWEVFGIEYETWRPTLAEIENFKGNFGTMRLPYLGNVGKPPYDKVLWTPAYGAYPDDVRAKIRADYKKKYTHFQVQLRGAIYHDYFPPLDESPQFQNKILEELYADHLIPVVNIYADDDQDIELDSSVLKNILCGFTKWDGADGFDDEPSPGIIIGKNKDHILQVKENCEWINLYFHYLANYGSPCGTTAVPPIATHGADWWRFARDAGVLGYLLQTYFEGEYQDIVNSTLSFHAAMQVRWAGFHGWPTGMDLIMFENVEYHVKNDPDYWTEARCNQFNETLLTAPLPSEGGYTGVPFSGYMSGRVNA